jgi:hypothetical protein
MLYYTEKSEKELEKMPTPRLLEYFRSVKSTGYKNSWYEYETDDEERKHQGYVTYLKSILDGREHVMDKPKKNKTPSFTKESPAQRKIRIQESGNAYCEKVIKDKKKTYNRKDKRWKSK